MKYFAVNGLFFTQQVSGVQRYAMNVLNEIDKCYDDWKNEIKIDICIPGGNIMPACSYKHLPLVACGVRQGRLWEQIDFYRYVRHNQSYSVNLCNTAPLWRPDILVLHDVGYKNHRVIKEVGGNKLKRPLRDLQNIFYTYRAQYIFTDTKASAQDICKYFSVAADKIIVGGCGYEHYPAIKSDESVFERYPDIKKRKYYFAMSNLSEHKNFRWVLENAKINPQNQYVISGAANPRYFVFDENLSALENVHYLGRTTDAEACALMASCRAFISPSLYEGFGLTPLEALSVGADIIVSDIPPHREIYGTAAHYIDPRKYDYNLDGVLEQLVYGKEKVLQHYTWKNVAKRLLKVMQEM